MMEKIEKEYIGDMFVTAYPMSRGEYCHLRGWEVPADEDANDEGYHLIRDDGSVSWMLKSIFENTFRELKGLEELKMDLLTNKYTRVFKEEEYSYNAPHHYFVTTSDEYSRGLGHIHFQEGSIKEYGVNGVCNEDLICMVIDRMSHFQRSEFACRENERALEKLEEALLWLRKRTMGREARGVEGTHTV